MATSNIDWPKVFPYGLQSGREYRRTSPNKRTRMGTGRELQRRKWPNAPWYCRVTWLMTDAQAQAFQAWARDKLGDCILWFNMPLRTPLGLNMHAVRIVDFYDGPTEAGPNLWTIGAELEFDKEPLAPVGEGEFPEEIAGSEIFDITMNRNWPKNDRAL